MNDEICLHYSKARKLKNWLREAVTKPYNVIVILALVLLTYLILFPMYEMIKTTFLGKFLDFTSPIAAKFF